MAVSICVYCGASPADGVEHWLPRWLGAYRGADTLLDRLCRKCNKLLGDTVDTPMSRMGPEALDRYRYQIEGRATDWEKANPYRYKTQRAEPPTVATASMPGFEVPLLMEDIPGTNKPDRRPQRQLIVRDDRGAERALSVPTGCPEDWIVKALATRGLIGSTLTRIVCEKVPGSEAIRPGGQLPGWFYRALFAAFPDAKDIEWLLPTGGAHVDLPGPLTSLTVNLDGEYLRGLAKLAFHYALKHLPWLDGRHDNFAPVRNFIYLGHGTPADFVDLNAPPFMLAAGGAEASVKDGHALLLNVAREEITVHFRSFVRSFYSRPAVRVRLGVTPADAPRHSVAAHHLCLFAGREGDYDGEMVEVRTMFRDGRWGAILVEEP